MLLAPLDKQDADRIDILPLADSPYNETAWIRAVQKCVADAVRSSRSLTERVPNLALIGSGKDFSDYYVKRFPQWQRIQIEAVPKIDSAAICSHYFAEGSDFEQFNARFAAQLPTSTRAFLADYARQPAYHNLYAEHQFVQQFKQSWAAAPYPPVFVTVDAVVVQAGHLLLVERKFRPGKGLMALPGGFIDPNETLFEACLRELREETRLKVPDTRLQAALKGSQIFDAPDRSARGRTLTQAFFFELPASASLPAVEGYDDAAKAFWLPLAELKPECLFEDHYFIIEHLLGQ